MFKTIFGKFFWTSILIMLTVTISITICLGVLTSYHFRHSQYESIMRINDEIETELNESIVNGLAPRVFSQRLNDKALLLNSDIIIFSRDGSVIEATSDTVTDIPSKYVEKILNGDTIHETGAFGDSHRQNKYIVAFPIRYSKNIVGGIIYISQLSAISKSVALFNITFMLASIIAIIISFGLIFKQSSSISQPLRKINRAVLNIASGNFSERVPVESSDEIGQLASSFNFMADSLESQNKLRDRFISDVSHELRTPMTSISGFVGGILDGTIPQENQEEYLRIVKDESERLTKMVNEMLEMSKISSKEYKLNVTEFDLNELIRRCIIELEQKITEHELDLNVEFSRESIRVIADEDSIKRVMINLLDNAVKFSHANTAIHIKTEIKASLARVTVGNFGAGIDQDELSHIFDRFYKTDSSRTSSNSGAGLGLSFVKNIMNLHKQSVFANSRTVNENGLKYTTFTFTLELA